MEKITFKGKEFKGSGGEFLLRPNSNGGIILDTQSGQPIQVLNQYDAKMWANSKNLLRAAIEMYNQLHIHVSMMHNGLGGLDELEADRAADADLKKLETEILKSL